MLAHFRSTFWRPLALAVVVGLGFGFNAPAAAAQDVLVFAAASLKNALDDIGAQYADETGKKVNASYAASSALAKQIEQGAPADIFISADIDWMNYVAERRLIKRVSLSHLLGNRLMMVAPRDRPVTVTIAHGFPLGEIVGAGRLAMGDPAHVPAGKYAKAALESLGVWASVEGKLAPADSVRSALAMVSRGEAPLGIVYETDAKADTGVMVVGVFPQASYPPVVYPAALTAAGTDADAANFLAYLRSDKARAIFDKHGFSRPAD
ncbi:MAG TPA: molybdate ABC transporter substrate-binding protein [Azospirillaceae bacterium]|nr:molybdate ABC transporter substrate-binding protein [Azospirillaceae bacterium]